MNFLSPPLTNAHPHHPSRIELHRQNSQLSLSSSYANPPPVPFPQLPNQANPKSTKLDNTKFSDIFELKFCSSAPQCQRPIHNISSFTETSPTPSLQLACNNPGQPELPSLAYGPSTLPTSSTINNTQVSMEIQYLPMPSSSSPSKQNQSDLVKEENKMIKLTHHRHHKKPRFLLDRQVEETYLNGETDVGRHFHHSDSFQARDLKESRNTISGNKTTTPSMSATSLENAKGSGDGARVGKRKITQKRREQNRTHQRAYRERRDLAMKQKDKEIAHLTQEIQFLRNELTGIQKRWLVNPSEIKVHDPTTTYIYHNNDALDFPYVGEPSMVPFGTMATFQSQQKKPQNYASGILPPVLITQSSRCNPMTPSADAFGATDAFGANNRLSHREAPAHTSSLTWPEYYTDPSRARTDRFMGSHFLEDHQVMKYTANSFSTAPLSIAVGGTTVSTSQSLPLPVISSTNTNFSNASYYENVLTESGNMRNLDFDYPQEPSSSSSSSSFSSTIEPPHDQLSVGTSSSPSSCLSASPQ